MQWVPEAAGGAMTARRTHLHHGRLALAVCWCANPPKALKCYMGRPGQPITKARVGELRGHALLVVVDRALRPARGESSNLRPAGGESSKRAESVEGVLRQAAAAAAVGEVRRSGGDWARTAIGPEPRARAKRGGEHPGAAAALRSARCQPQRQPKSISYRSDSCVVVAPAPHSRAAMNSIDAACCRCSHYDQDGAAICDADGCQPLTPQACRLTFEELDCWECGSEAAAQQQLQQFVERGGAAALVRACGWCVQGNVECSAWLLRRPYA